MSSLCSHDWRDSRTWKKLSKISNTPQDVIACNKCGIPLMVFHRDNMKRLKVNYGYPASGFYKLSNQSPTVTRWGRPGRWMDEQERM